MIPRFGKTTKSIQIYLAEKIQTSFQTLHVLSLPLQVFEDASWDSEESIKIQDIPLLRFHQIPIWMIVIIRNGFVCFEKPKNVQRE